MERIPISATDIAKASRCIHTWYLECHGDSAERVVAGQGLRLMWERGREEERRRVATLPQVSEPGWDRKDWGAGHQETVNLMREGAPWIYQGVLVADWGRGLPDLLKRVEETSALGDHSYLPVDVKGHKEVGRQDRLQLVAYAHLLEPVLGARPTRGGIWLNTDRIEEVDLARDEKGFQALLERMKKIAEGGEVTQGMRCSECRLCPWLAKCAGEWERTQSVCRLYGVTGDTARKFAAAGFPSWRDIASSTPTDLSHALRMDLMKAADIHLSALAWASGRPHLKVPLPPSPGVPVHYYDIETYEGCTYLHGDIRVHEGRREERQFIARHPSEEGEVWRAYLDYLAHDEEAVVYCWADYERAPVHALWERYGGNEAGWRHLRDNLVDQCDLVRRHWALPTSSYGIKSVAPVFGFHWDAEDAGGLNSESWYRDWLAGGDEAILKKLLRYNLDDVLAMEVIDGGLRAALAAGSSDGAA